MIIQQAVREAMRKKVKAEPADGDTVRLNGAGGGRVGGGGFEDAGSGGVSAKKEEEEEDGGMVFTSTTEFTSRLEVSMSPTQVNAIESVFFLSFFLFFSMDKKKQTISPKIKSSNSTSADVCVHSFGAPTRDNSRTNTLNWLHRRRLAGAPRHKMWYRRPPAGVLERV